MDAHPRLYSCEATKRTTTADGGQGDTDGTLFKADGTIYDSRRYALQGRRYDL